MAERVVIADLDLGDIGVERASARVQGHLRGIEGGLARATQRMFSLTNASRALLGGFTLAGAILAFKNFAESVIRADKNFKLFDASTTVLKGSLLGLAGELAGVSSGLETMSEAALRTAAVSEFLRTRGKDLAATLRETALTTTGLLIPAFGGLRALITEMANAIDRNLAPELARLRAERDKLLAGPPGLPPGSFALPETFARPIGAEGLEFANFEGISGALENFSPFADKAAESAQRFRDSMMGLQDTSFGFLNEWFRLSPSFSEVTVKAFADVEEAIDHATFTMAAWGIAADTAGQIVTRALTGQMGSFRKFLAVVGAQIAGIAVAQGIMHLVAAHAATTLVGAAATGGTPAQHKAIAIDYFQLAAIAGGAALLLGSRSGDSSGRTGGRAGDFVPLASQTRAAPVINLTIEGNVIGNEDYTRQLVNSLQKALTDGSGGGRLT